MKMLDRKEIINNIIQNEFNNIAEYKEQNFEKENLKDISEKYLKSMKNIEDILPEEHRKLLLDFETLVSDYMVEMEKFYFEQGVYAGIEGLNFLKGI